MGRHLTKMRRIALFIGLPDGEVFAKHLTRDLTRAPTIHCFLCAVATLGKATGRRVSGNGVASYAAAYVLLRAETLFRPYNGADVEGHAILCKQSVPLIDVGCSCSGKRCGKEY